MITGFTPAAVEEDFAKAASGSVGGAGPARLLLVDDDPRNLRLLVSLLAGRGYHLLSAGSGEEALAILSGQTVDLMLLDAVMPGLSGFELCERLRSDPVARRLPVVMVTALNSVDEKVRALEAGADEFLSKPVDRAELLARIRSLLRAKRLCDEIDAARRDLSAKNAELQRLEAHKTTLMQMIVHDLRGPLSGIMGHTELLRGKVEGVLPQLERWVHGILIASRHMRGMLNDLLDVSLLQENRLVLRPERMDLRATATLIVEEHRPLAEACEVSLAVSAGAKNLSRQGPVLLADAGIIQRVIGNLVDNAVKHTPAGGFVRIEIGEPHGGSIEFRVADTGEGIPEEARARIFDKGAPAPSQKHVARQDPGLGLTFCRMAVEAHGGRIWVQPNDEGGCTFAFALPMTPCDDRFEETASGVGP